MAIVYNLSALNIRLYTVPYHSSLVPDSGVNSHPREESGYQQSISNVLMIFAPRLSNTTLLLKQDSDIHLLHCIVTHPISLSTSTIASTIPTDLASPLVLNP